MKTRLAAAIGAEAAAHLARSMFDDLWRSVTRLDWARLILVSTEPSAPEWQSYAPPAVWPQAEGDLGERMEHSLRRAISEYGLAIAVGSDAPGLPAAHLRAAFEALENADAVLGPAADGGFYLIGLRKCPAGLLDHITWSEPSTMALTIRRIESYGLRVQQVAPWFDVDTAEDLRRLKILLAHGCVTAPATARAIIELGV